MALWRQTTIAATVVGVFLVSAYFVCAGILSVTAPALFSLQPFNTSRHSVISTTLGPPNISINNLYVVCASFVAMIADAYLRTSVDLPIPRASGWTPHQSFHICLIVIVYRRLVWRMEHYTMCSPIIMGRVTFLSMP